MGEPTTRAANDGHAPGIREGLFLASLLALPAIHLLSVSSLFWDLAVVERVIGSHARGETAYRLGAGLQFVYPPVTLELLRNIPPRFIDTLIVLNAAVIFVPLMLVRTAGNSLAEVLRYLALLLVPMGAMGAKAYSTGNLTLTLYVVVIGSVLLSYRSRRAVTMVLLSGVIVFASMFKPYFLAFFMVLVFRQRLLGTGLAVLGVTATALLILAYPDAASLDAWVDAMRRQTQGFERDLGSSLFGVLRPLINDLLGKTWRPGAYIAANLGVNVVLGCWFLMVLPAFDTLDDRRKWLISASLVLYAVMINPRLKIYDAFLLPCFAYALLPLLFRDKRVCLALLYVMLASYLLRFLPGWESVSMVAAQIVCYAAIAMIMGNTTRWRRELSHRVGHQPEFSNLDEHRPPTST